MAKKLKILHTMTWLAKGGGVDHNVLLTINGLKDEFEFHLAAGNEIYHNPFKDIPGLKFMVCKDLVRPIHIIHDFKAMVYFIRLIRREKYDIVHTHEAKASLISRMAAYLAGCRYIIYGLHGVTFNDPMSRLKRKFYVLAERLTIGVSDLIVGVSHDVIGEYHRNGIGKKIPFRVVHSGIDVSRFFRDMITDDDSKEKLKTTFGIGRGDLVLINIGRFSFSKAQRFTILGFAELKKNNPGMKLMMVGEGELLETCRQLVKKLGLEKDVIFTGFSDRVATLLSIADIHVLTSLREGLPRVAVEASLMKVPTVAFEVEGIREVIINDESGCIVPTENIQLLVERVNDLIHDPAKRKRFGERACERVKREWDSNLMLDQLRKIYTQEIQN